MKWGFDEDGDVTIFVWFISFTIYKTSVVWEWGNAIKSKGTKQLWANMKIAKPEEVVNHE